MFSCHSFLPLSDGSHFIKMLCTSLLSEIDCETFVFFRESSLSITLLLQIFVNHFLLSPSGTCVIFHSSGYDTQAKVNNKGGTEYGLFQISNKHWCKSSEVPESENICDIPCDSE